MGLCISVVYVPPAWSFGSELPFPADTLANTQPKSRHGAVAFGVIRGGIFLARPGGCAKSNESPNSSLVANVMFFGLVLKCYKHPWYCRYIAIIMQLQCKQCILRLRLECFDTRFRYNMFTCFDVGALASMSWVGFSWSKEEFQLLPSKYTYNHLDTWQYLAGSKSARDDEANSQALCRSTQHLHHLQAFLEAVERHLVGPCWTWTSWSQQFITAARDHLSH